MDDAFLERLRRALAPEFHVERLLASGGMGMVYLGREVSLDRPVAIKVMRPGSESARGVERFLREARTLANLRHPHIVAVHRVFENVDGLYCYTMDYLEGQTLEDRLERGALPAPDVLKLGRDLLDALGVVHRRGVVHRDIKPSNIFLSEHGAVLTDFGIAKTPMEGGGPLTGPGEHSGTLPYESPEQAMNRDVTARSDLYAVGAVLYEASTGQKWFAVENIETVDWSRLPVPLGSAVRRALELAPGNRWSSAGTFGRALWARRGPRWGVLTGTAAAVAGVAIATWMLIRPVQPPDLAIAPFEVTGGAGSSLGDDIATTVWRNLNPFTPIRLAPQRPQAGPTARAPRFTVTGTVAQRSDSLIVDFVVRDRRGQTKGGDRIGDRMSRKWELGGRIAFRLIQIVIPDSARAYGPVPPPTSNVQALNAYLAGDRDFRFDRWRQAEEHFHQAVALDSNFALAQWRLWSVQLWRRIPRTVDLQRLLRHREQLTASDSILIAAELSAPGADRLMRYREAVARDPGDDYVRLLYASELFHRGPLSGVPLDSGVAVLQDIVRTRATLAPALDQLAWGSIWLGRRAVADSALTRLRALPNPEERDIDPRVLVFAGQARFGPPGSGQVPPEMMDRLFDFARLGLAFDIAPVELTIGSALARSSRASPARRADGHAAMGLALAAMGRFGDAVAHFDSVAVLLGTASAGLQAAQWRVIPGALGLPGAPPAEVERGRGALVDLAGARGGVGTRAAWTLALDAYTRGDLAAGRQWRERVVGARRLATLLQGTEAAAGGDVHGALAATDALDRHEDHGRLEDAFERAVLHLERAAWQDRLGAGAAADSTRLWWQNSDFEGWLNGEIQPVEVDWVLGMHARWRLAMDAARRGARASACARLERVVEIWAAADSVFRPLVADARRAAQPCPR